MIHRHIQIKQEKTHYWVTGNKSECIAFIHGALMDHMLFKHQIDFFKSDYRIIVCDVPAHGQSRPYSGFSLKKAADTLVRILDQEKIETAHLVGQSMGGYIAQIAGRFYPEKVTSITVIGSSPIQPRYYSKLDTWLLKLTPSILRIYPYNLLIKTIAKQVSLQEEGQTYALRTLKQYSKDEIVDVMKEVYVGVQQYLENKTLDIPMMITHGDVDRTGKVRSYSKKWAELEQLPLEVIPNAAHNANMDNPTSFNEILKSFLSGNQNDVPSIGYV